MIQELILASATVFVCGHHSISGQRLQLASNIIRDVCIYINTPLYPHQKTALRLFEAYNGNASSILMRREMYELFGASSLPEMLKSLYLRLSNGHTTPIGATDPRDRIFAILP